MSKTTKRPSHLILGTDEDNKMKVVASVKGEKADNIASDADMEDWSNRASADAVKHAKQILAVAGGDLVVVRKWDVVELLTAHDDLASLASTITCYCDDQLKCKTEDDHRGQLPKGTHNRLNKVARGA